MNLRILRKDEQMNGQFNGGAVLEKRPIVYQGRKTLPYSNLFYWAHAWSAPGSTIGLHPHQGFEIMSFVLKGSIEHYDTKNKSWIPLQTGSVQIIRAGNGISHAEKLNPGSSIFQIWFDPNLQESMEQPATYNDYDAGVFPVTIKDGVAVRTFKGSGAPVQMKTEGITIKKMELPQGKHTLEIPDTKILSVFVLEGKIKIGSNQLSGEDFFTIHETSLLEMVVDDPASLFVIESPVVPSYTTYASQMHA